MKSASGGWRISGGHGLRAEDVGGECVQLGGGVGPGVFGHAEFFRAQSGQKLLSRPSGVARDLGKKQSRPAADGQMNPVSGRLEIQRRWGFFQGAENGDFDFKIGQFVTGDGLSEESRIAYHAFGRGYERFAQRFCGVESSDASAQGMWLATMQGDETSRGSGKNRIVQGQERARVAAEPAGDHVGRQIENGPAGLSGNVHRTIS